MMCWHESDIGLCLWHAETGLEQSSMVARSSFPREARTVPDYQMFDLGGYPGMVSAEEGEGKAIEGEVWEVDKAAMLGLDRLEGVAEGEYALERVQLDGRWAKTVVMGYVYLRSVKGYPEVKGSWME